MKQLDDILHFWFDRQSGESGTGQARKVWFTQDPGFDREVKTRFQALYEQAAAGLLTSWQDTPEGCVAMILLLDQFPRNMFRGQPQAFATDRQALAIAQSALDRGFDQALNPLHRWFLYIPFMHSEQLSQQQRAVDLFATLKDDPDVATAYPYAIRHRDVIAQFGRFPHRNAILSRETTPEEAEFLKQPGSSF